MKQHSIRPCIRVCVLLLFTCLLGGCLGSGRNDGLVVVEAPPTAVITPAPTMTPTATPVPTPTPTPTPEPTPQTASCSLRLVGDLMCCEYQMLGAIQPDGSYDFNPPFDAVRAELESADLTIGNLETNFYPEKPYCGTKIGFNAPLAYLDAIKNCGFDIMVTANNHSLDMGIEGLLTTVEAVRAAGMDNVGTNLTPEESEQVYVREVNGLKLGLLSYSTIANKTETLKEHPDAGWAFNYYSHERLTADVAKLKAAGAEVLMIYVHGGVEKDKTPRRAQLELEEHAYSLGVDIVIMSHTHSLLPMEKKTIEYQGREKTVFCAYGLGNFMSSALHDESLRNVILGLDLTFDRASGELSCEARYIPTFTINFYD